MSKTINPKNGKIFNELVLEGYKFDEIKGQFAIRSTDIKYNIISSDTQITKFVPTLPEDYEIKSKIIIKGPIKYVIHLSDIHIPINMFKTRQDEYYQVINNLIVKDQIWIY